MASTTRAEETYAVYMGDRTMYQVIRRAGGAQQQAVLDILTEAFMDDPVVRWLFPDEGDRRRLQPLVTARCSRTRTTRRI